MDQLISAFGIDGKLIIAQIINFIILASLLTYFLYKPVLKILTEREEKIKQGIKDAEAAAKAKAMADEEKNVILAAAHQNAQEVGAHAKKFADEKAATIVAAAQHKAEQVLVDAQKRQEEMKVQARKDSEAEVAKLAILAAEKILREKVS